MTHLTFKGNCVNDKISIIHCYVSIIWGLINDACFGFCLLAGAKFLAYGVKGNPFVTSLSSKLLLWGKTYQEIKQGQNRVGYFRSSTF